MAKSLSEDLRVGVIRAVEGGLSRHAAAARFGINVSVPGAVPGGAVQVAFSVASTAVLFLGTIGASGTVTAVAWNRSSSTVDLAAPVPPAVSGTPS